MLDNLLGLLCLTGGLVAVIWVIRLLLTPQPTRRRIYYSDNSDDDDDDTALWAAVALEDDWSED